MHLWRLWCTLLANSDKCRSPTTEDCSDWDQAGRFLCRAPEHPTVIAHMITEIPQQNEAVPIRSTFQPHNYPGSSEHSLDSIALNRQWSYPLIHWEKTLTCRLQLEGLLVIPSQHIASRPGQLQSRIMFSASPEDGFRAHALRWGVSGYICVPLKLKENLRLLHHQRGNPRCLKSQLWKLRVFLSRLLPLASSHGTKHPTHTAPPPASCENTVGMLGFYCIIYLSFKSPFSAMHSIIAVPQSCYAINLLLTWKLTVECRIFCFLFFFITGGMWLVYWCG